MRLEEVQIKNSLKILMKKQGLQYRDLAQALGISTATVKRRLNKGDLGISQLTELAECLSVSLYDLIDLSKNEDSKVYIFSDEQEQLFAKDLSYLLLFRAIVMDVSFKEIAKQLNLKEPELRKRLRHLEDVKLIKLMPQDRISALAKFPFKWRENGALQKAYFTKNITSLFNHIKARYKFSVHDESSGALCKPFEILLSVDNRKSFSRDLMEVYTKYQRISQIELKSKNKSSVVVSGIVFADDFSIWQTDNIDRLFF